MKHLGMITAGFAAAMIGSLLLAHAHPFGDAGLYGTHAGSPPQVERSSVPPEVRAILSSKCADCHSLQTRAPLYGRFAPISWLMERDIVEGRKHMNLSGWEDLSPSQQEAYAAKIVRETKTHQMPLLQYRLIHWNARITNEDLQTLTRWARSYSSGSGDADTTSSIGIGDPTKGKEVFEKRCTGCHAMDQNREGPKLKRVFGRNAGVVDGFAYSAALKTAHIVWNERSLNQWLTDPDAMVTGNDMEFHVPKETERRDLIAFLKQGSL